MNDQNHNNEDVAISLHHVAVQTGNFDNAVRFYRDVLGAELLRTSAFKTRRIAWFRIGSVKLEVQSCRDGERLDAWSDFYCGPVHICLNVVDVTRFVHKALERGGKLHPSHPEPFVPPIPGARHVAYLLGPDGEEVEVRDVTDET